MDDLKEDYEKFKNELIKENEEFKNEVTQLLDEKIKEIDEKLHELDLLVSNLQLQWTSFRDFINQNITAQNEKIDQLHELIKVIQNDLELIHNVIDKLDQFMKDYEELLSRVDTIEADFIEAKNDLDLHIKDFNDFKTNDENFHNQTNLKINDIQSQITVINDTISNIDINSITEKLTEIENTVNDMTNKVNTIDDLLTQVEKIENEITVLTEKTNKIDDLEGHLTTVENEIGDITQIDPYTNIVDNLKQLNESGGSGAVSPFEKDQQKNYFYLKQNTYLLDDVTAIDNYGDEIHPGFIQYFSFYFEDAVRLQTNYNNTHIEHTITNDVTESLINAGFEGWHFFPFVAQTTADQTNNEFVFLTNTKIRLGQEGFVIEGDLISTSPSAARTINVGVFLDVIAISPYITNSFGSFDSLT